MAESKVGVRPSTTTGSVDIITDKHGTKEWPAYKTAFGDADNVTRVDATNPLPIAIIDYNGNNAIEQYSGSLRTIEQEHATIHDGNGYQLSGEIAALANAASAYFLIDPSAPIHWRDYRLFSDDAPIDIEFFENPTTTDNGTTLTPLNRNRLSANTSTAAVYSGPTVTADGSRLYISRIVGTGTGANKTGEVEGLPVEWIIDGGNTYLLKVTNNSGGPVDLIYQFFWYEL